MASDNTWEILGLDHRQDILEAIFNVSDLKSLKQFRLVCHIWNKEVLRVLEEKSYIQTCRGSLVFLHSTLENCPTPQHFFTSLEIHFSDSGVNKILKNILEKYGHHLKNLRCAGDIRQSVNNIAHSVQTTDLSHIRKNIQITSKMLTAWCPNLQSVRFSTSIQTPDCTTIDSEFRIDPNNHNCSTSRRAELVNFQNMYPTTASSLLRLTSIELDGYMISSLRTYCLQLLSLSPELTKLKLAFGVKFVQWTPVWEPVPDVVQFLVELQRKVEVTQKLKEFTVIGLKVPRLIDVTSELEFSPDKLRAIGVSGSTNVSDPEFHKFVTFLEKLSTFQNLAKLTIFKCSCSCCEWRNWREKSRWTVIEQTVPVMEHIRHLDIASNGTHGIASLSLLNKFPKLHTLEFSLSKVGHANPDLHRGSATEHVDFDYFMTEWIYLKMTSKYGGLLKINCSNIKNLTIHHTLFKLESIKCIQEAFINITKLTISIRSAVQYCWEVYMEDKLSLSSCLETLVKLTNLEELYITMPKGVVYPKQEISKAIKVLRGFPELRRINVSLGPPCYSNRSPFRCGDASDPSINQLFSDFILTREIHKFRSLIIIFKGICCCYVSQPELLDLRKVLSSYNHSYQFNWCCHQSARILARYGNKRYEFSPAKKRNSNENKDPKNTSSELCESSHYSIDFDESLE